MVKFVPFKDIKIGEEFIYLSRTYRKIRKPNGKVGALHIISQQIYHDCKSWIGCAVFYSDPKLKKPLHRR